jgi:hypothetical protein
MLSPARKHEPRLSLLKVAAMARETLAAMWPPTPCPEQWEKHLGSLLHPCCYDKRKRRHPEEIWEDGLG